MEEYEERSVTPELDHRYAYKHSIVNELFIKTADDNYVTARWCFANGLDVEFFGWVSMRSKNISKQRCSLTDGQR